MFIVALLIPYVTNARTPIEHVINSHGIAMEMTTNNFVIENFGEDFITGNMVVMIESKEIGDYPTLNFMFDDISSKNLRHRAAMVSRMATGVMQHSHTPVIRASGLMPIASPVPWRLAAICATGIASPAIKISVSITTRFLRNLRSSIVWHVKKKGAMTAPNGIASPANVDNSIFLLMVII